MEAFALSPDAVRVPLPQRLLSDDRLLRLVAAGNPQAFGAVYARYHAPLYAYCRSIVRDPEDAKDALQNTMVKALAALGRGEDRDLPLKPWLFRIAHNESVTLLRRRKPSEPLTDAVSPPVAGVDTQAIARERLGQLVEDLQELPERQRAALIMREVNGLSYDDIAGALAISPGAARQTVFEARSALAEYGEGREVACESIRRSISDGDGRAMRARRVRAHLRSCNACRDFHSALKVRRRELHLLAPGLSGGTAMALLQGVLGAGTIGGGAAATGGAGLLGGSASAVLASGAAKGVVALVAVSAVGAGAVHIAAPSHHRSQHSGAPVAAAASAGSRATTASGASGQGATAAGSIAAQALAVLPAAAGHHRSVSVLDHPGAGLGRPDAALGLPPALHGHGHHQAVVVPGSDVLVPGAGHANGNGNGHHHGGPSNGDGQGQGSDAAPADQPTGDGTYSGWAGHVHHGTGGGHHADAPSVPADTSGDGSDSSGDLPADTGDVTDTSGTDASGDSSSGDTSGDGGGDASGDGGGDTSGYSPWHSGGGSGSGGGWHHTGGGSPDPTADPSSGDGSGGD